MPRSQAVRETLVWKVGVLPRDVNCYCLDISSCGFSRAHAAKFFERFQKVANKSDRLKKFLTDLSTFDIQFAKEHKLEPIIESGTRLELCRVDLEERRSG